MMDMLDRVLDRITMYRLVLYVLLTYIGFAWLAGLFGWMPFSGSAVLISASAIFGVAWIANHVFARIFQAPVHSESALITALILACIVPPFQQSSDAALIFWAPVLAIAGKYILAWHKQHVWNPAALAVVITALVLNLPASWWIGNATMLPVVVIGGFLIVKKLRRWEVVLSFLAIALGGIVIAGWMRHTALTSTLQQALVLSPIIFFSTVMLTEPLTMPPTRIWRLAYAATIGVLYIPQLHLGSVYSTPELALVLGNIVFYSFVGRERYVLKLREKHELAPLTYEFIFDADRQPHWTAGQYFEWTLQHQHADQRGQRRYFTVASSPGENGIHLGVKFAGDRSSTFKHALFNMQPGQSIVAAQRDGDFTLPDDPKQKLVFIAGGIGVTPYRSMVQWLCDQKQPRPIILFYAAKTPEEFVYTELFRQAQQAIGLQTKYVITDTQHVPSDWRGLTGFLTPEMVQREVPDYAERVFYLSGPQAMVKNYEHLLQRLGLPKSQIKTDYFPGFA